MSEAHRYADLCTGHDAHMPRINFQGSTNVFINNRPAHRIGDAWPDHPNTAAHTTVMGTGSTTVFANNRPLARIGDLVSCGSLAATGSSNVFAGD